MCRGTSHPNPYRCPHARLVHHNGFLSRVTRAARPQCSAQAKGSAAGVCRGQHRGHDDRGRAAADSVAHPVPPPRRPRRQGIDVSAQSPTPLASPLACLPPCRRAGHDGGLSAGRRRVSTAQHGHTRQVGFSLPPGRPSSSYLQAPRPCRCDRPPHSSTYLSATHGRRGFSRRRVNIPGAQVPPVRCRWTLLSGLSSLQR